MRIGRGGKRGNYSGRGHKGQKSRAGRNIRPAERDLIIRIPKLRGYKNKPKSTRPVIINLRDIIKIRGAKIVDKEFLIKNNLVKPNQAVKILGKGIPREPLLVKGLDISAGARLKIESAGGKVS